MKLSPSALTIYYKCPYKFKLAYIDKFKPLPPLEKVLFGRVLHEIIAKYYEIIPENLSSKEIPLFLSQAIKSVGANIDNFNTQLKFFRIFEEQRLKWNLVTKPLAIEKEFSRGIFHGIIDVIFKKFDGRLVGIDWKSGNVDFNNINYVLAGFIYIYIANLDEIIFISLNTGMQNRLSKNELNQFKESIINILKGIKERKFDKNEGDQCYTCEYSLACQCGENYEADWD